MNAVFIRRLSVNGSLGLLALCCFALGACNHDAEQAQQTVPVKTSKPAASSSSVDPLAGMVKAVTSDKRHQAIELRFELAGRPQVGQPVDIKLMLRAIDDSTDVKLTISTDPKLAIIAGGDIDFASIKTGEVVSHTVTLRSISTGLIVIDANLAATSNGGPHTLTYAIPIAITDPVVQSSASSVATKAAPSK